MILIDKDLQIFQGSQIRKIKPMLRLKKLIYISVTLNILLSVTLYTSLTKPTSIIHVMTRDTLIIDKSDVALNDSAILRELVKEGCVLPGVALAQFKIESSHYQSKVCKENKNLAGIKYHKCKYVKGELNNHALYHSYRDNIKCYAHIQEKYLKNIDGKYASVGGYVELIKDFK